MDGERKLRRREDGQMCRSDGERGWICDGSGNVVGEKSEINIVKSGL